MTPRLKRRRNMTRPAQGQRLLASTRESPTVRLLQENQQSKVVATWAGATGYALQQTGTGTAKRPSELGNNRVH